jgi:membrane-associated phospholipid phosphatase
MLYINIFSAETDYANLRIRRVIHLIIVLLVICETMFAQIGDSSSLRIVPLQSSSIRFVDVAVPAAMITYGAVSLGNGALWKSDNNIKTALHNRRYIIRTSFDDYLQFSPAVAAFGMKIAGVKSRHNLCDMAILYALGNGLETGIVVLIKSTSGRLRPDGSAHNSFPSGHTATAFVAAEFLHQEYKDQSVWISVGGYTAATLTGMFRMLNNRHWFSDVVAGAGIGILSVKTVYWTYPLLRKIWTDDESKNMSYCVYPAFNNGSIGIGFTHNF